MTFRERERSCIFRAVFEGSALDLRMNFQFDIRCWRPIVVVVSRRGFGEAGNELCKLFKGY